MRINFIQIRNFKGIGECSIELASGPPGNIVTLVGLNESGKTTILEALSNFVSGDEDTATLFETTNPKRPLTDLVPKDKKAAFNDRISIRADITIEADDISALSQSLLREHDLTLDSTNFDNHLIVERSFTFKESVHVETNNYWTIGFPLRKKRSKHFKWYNHTGEARPIWLAAIRFLASRLPKISYFPTFLFEFPDRIYLEDHEKETPTNRYYRQVMQDILDAQGDGLRVDTHIVERVKKSRSAAANPPTFWFNFFKTDEKAQVDAVVRKIANEMGRVIFGAWNEVFDRKIVNRRISLEWSVDVDKANIVYVQLYIIDGQSQYALAERSLGFRWFFAFLLFTQFRGYRKESASAVFLFDEPASNLHARAQMQLLQSFTKIAQNVNFIVYSTHSHYMIEPLWLEKAYIVDNRAIDYEDKGEDLDYFSTRATDIRAVKYRRFVGQNPGRTTYFQPVLDKLKYVVSPLIGSRDCLIIEGKLDFHAMRYFLEAGGVGEEYDIIPSVGAESMDVLISLCVGWGRRFLIILDDDQAGRRARERYLTKTSAKQESVATLGDLSKELRGKKFEGLFSQEIDDQVKAAYSLNRASKKDEYSLFFQEKVATKQFDIELGAAKGTIAGLIAAVRSRMESQ